MQCSLMDDMKNGPKYCFRLRIKSLFFGTAGSYGEEEYDAHSILEGSKVPYHPFLFFPTRQAKRPLFFTKRLTTQKQFTGRRYG